MYKFDNNNIFTGYIKQLLAEFNLPTYRIYGAEAAKIHDQYQKIIKKLDSWYDDYENEIEELTKLINLYGDSGTTPIGDSIVDLQTRLNDLKFITVDAVDSELKEVYNRLLVGESIGIIQQSINNKRNAIKFPLIKEDESAEPTATGKYVYIDAYGHKFLYTEAEAAAYKSPDVHVLVFNKENIAKYRSLLENDLLISTIYRETPSTYTNKGYVDYPTKMRYIPYIKDGKIQEYVYDTALGSYRWISAHEELGEDHKKVHGSDYSGGAYTDKLYIYNRFDRNYSTTLPVTNNEYDYETHEYLGEYLRFTRDYFGLNLMPLYNCFSNRICPNIDFKITVRANSSPTVKDGYIAKFNTQDKGYKIYMVPVKMFKKYTLAMECPRGVEMFCGLFGKYYNSSDEFAKLATSTYTCYNNLSFGNPVVYTKLFDFTNWLDMTDRASLAIMEKNLKLFIKVPAELTTSIVVLEGDYTNGTSAILHGSETIVPTDSIAYRATSENSVVKHSYSVINFEHIDELVDENFEPSTELQLLRINTGVSYPFADRLIEYLTGNAITPLDSLPDNVERVKTVVYSNTSKNVMSIYPDGIWDSRLRYILYTYMTNKNKYKIDKIHDCLGYVDKDVETTYKYATNDRKDTIASVNIYGKTWEE